MSSFPKDFDSKGLPEARVTAFGLMEDGKVTVCFLDKANKPIAFGCFLPHKALTFARDLAVFALQNGAMETEERGVLQ